MSEQVIMSVQMKKYLGVIGVWLLSLLIIFAFPLDIPIITGVAFLLFFLPGLILLILFLIALFRKKSKYEPTLAILLVILICIAVFKQGVWWGAKIHLWVNKSRYEAVVAKLSLAQNSEEREKICGDDCLILSDEPLRVAFHYSHWFLNWKDIVYDPTGAVSGGDYDKLKYLSVYLFGGEHLTGEWYLGHFGD